MRVLIIGAGELGQAAADILLQNQRFAIGVKPIGFVDDDASLVGWQYVGLSVLGGVSAIDHIPHDEVLVAVDDNAMRCHLYERLLRNGAKFATARHVDAAIASDAAVGPGTIVCAGVVIGPRAVIGADCVLNSGCCIAHDSRLGDHVYIGPAAFLSGGVIAGEGATIGSAATVLARRRIGTWGRVGADSVIERDVPEGLGAGIVPADLPGLAVSAGPRAGARAPVRVRCLRPLG
jgi:sugar O-acyltransferase (sialic acid O-acetyltransferase NeuD family)